MQLMYVCMYVCSRVRVVVEFISSALLTRCHTLVTLHISRLREMSNPHARVDINKDIVVDMFKTERKSLR